MKQFSPGFFVLPFPKRLVRAHGKHQEFSEKRLMNFEKRLMNF